MADGDYVYVFWRENGHHKIGWSRNPTRRANGIKSIERSNIIVVCTIARDGDAFNVEQAAHMFLLDRHVEGEWFAVSAEEAVGAVRLACADMDRLSRQRKRSQQIEWVEAQLGRRMSRTEIQERQNDGQILR